jgi:hypothetical protein
VGILRRLARRRQRRQRLRGMPARPAGTYCSVLAQRRKGCDECGESPVGDVLRRFLEGRDPARNVRKEERKPWKPWREGNSTRNSSKCKSDVKERGSLGVRCRRPGTDKLTRGHLCRSAQLQFQRALSRMRLVRLASGLPGLPSCPPCQIHNLSRSRWLSFRVHTGRMAVSQFSMTHFDRDGLQV